MGFRGTAGRFFYMSVLLDTTQLSLLKPLPLPPPHPPPASVHGQEAQAGHPDSNNPHDSSPVCAVLPQTRYKGEAVAGGFMVPVNTVVNFV